MDRIIRLTKTLNDKGIMIRESELPKYVKDRTTAWFQSLYYFPEDSLVYFKENKGSIAGYKGQAYLNDLVFDIDAKDLEVSRANTIRLIDSLKSKGLYTEESAIISFSGSKGFHLFVNTEHTFSPKELKAVCMILASDVEFIHEGGFKLDSKIYNTTRPFRLVNTANEKSRLYKINVTESDLRHFTSEQLKEYARKEQPVFTYTDSIPEAKISKLIAELDFTSDDKEYALVKVTKLAHTPPCYLKIEQGEIGDGESNTALLRLCNFYRTQGFTKEEATAKLREVGLRRMECYPDTNPIDMTKIKWEIIKPVYRGGYTFTCNDDYLSSKCEDSCPVKKVVPTHFAIKSVPVVPATVIPPILEPLTRGSFRVNLPITENKMTMNGRGLKTMTDTAKTYGKFINDLESKTVVTGIDELDNVIRIVPYGLMIINSRPSVGKTTIMLNIAKNSAKRDQNCLIYSIDMDEDEFYTKALSSVMRRSPDEVLVIRTDPASADLIHDVDVEVQLALSTSIINYDKRISVSKIEEDINYLAEQKKLPDVVIIDYIQKIQGADGDPAEALERLKSIQAKYKVNIIVLSQVPRSSGNVTIDETTPIFTSGASLGGTAYEANGSIIVNFWRPLKHEAGRDKYIAYHIAKNRMGETKGGILYFNGAHSEIRTCTEEEAQTYAIWKMELDERKKAKASADRGKFR